MWKIFKLFVLLLLVLGVIYIYSIYKDSQRLSDQIIRLHIVADTDEPADQEAKLLVRDEILGILEEINDGTVTKTDAIEYLQAHLQELQQAANAVLAQAGKTYNAVVSLQKEEFPSRLYETFTLPAGIYDSLRITIGSGEGKNWWCVVFPDLCSTAAAVQVEDTAIEAGISSTLSKTITRAEGYEVRFWLLDCIGKLQNLLHKL